MKWIIGILLTNRMASLLFTFWMVYCVMAYLNPISSYLWNLNFVLYDYIITTLK